MRRMEGDVVTFGALLLPPSPQSIFCPVPQKKRGDCAAEEEKEGRKRASDKGGTKWLYSYDSLFLLFRLHSA